MNSGAGTGVHLSPARVHRGVPLAVLCLAAFSGLDGSPQRVPSEIGHRWHGNVALRQGNSRNRPPSSGRTTLK
jgi:hypothetical protein